MIFTIGNRENYLKAIEENGTIDKASGGCAFNSVHDALFAIQESGNLDTWAVWVVDAEWGKDTQPDPNGGWWHVLIRDARIMNNRPFVDFKKELKWMQSIVKDYPIKLPALPIWIGRYGL